MEQYVPPRLDAMVPIDRIELALLSKFGTKIHAVVLNHRAEWVAQVGFPLECIFSALEEKLRIGLPTKCWEELDHWISQKLTDDSGGIADNTDCSKWTQDSQPCRGLASHYVFKIPAPNRRTVGLVVVGPVLDGTDMDSHIDSIKAVWGAASRGLISDQEMKQLIAKRPAFSPIEISCFEAKGMEVVEILASEYRKAVLRKDVWVAMPYKPQFDDAYEFAIKPSLTRLGYTSKRADQLTPPGEIMATLEDEIRDCAFVVADISSDNANVAYEVGFARALQKNMVLITRDDEVLFSFRGKPHMKYELNHIGGLGDMLEKKVQSLQREGVIANPTLFNNEGARIQERAEQRASSGQS